MLIGDAAGAAPILTLPNAEEGSLGCAGLCLPPGRTVGDKSDGLFSSSGLCLVESGWGGRGQDTGVGKAELVVDEGGRLGDLIDDTCDWKGK